MQKKYLFLVSSFASLPLLLNACGILSPAVTPTVKQYQITAAAAASDAPACKAVNSAILQVSQVQVFAPYDTKNMYYSESQYQLNNYSLNQWATQPSSMFTQAVLQKLLQSCIYSNVVSSDFVATAKYRLVMQLMDFKQIINGNDASMNLTLLAELIDNTTNQVIKSKTFSETSPTTPNAQGYIAGANAATAQLLSDLTAWLGS